MAMIDQWQARQPRIGCTLPNASDEVEQVTWNSAFNLTEVLVSGVCCSLMNTFRRSPEEAGSASASIAVLSREHGVLPAKDRQDIDPK
jgi:hypothetical protein